MSADKDALLIRREYNQWVANETLEDYALRYTAKQARRWSTGWVANTALGIVSFLALEAIGGAITLSYGFTNAMWAIFVVGFIIFLSGLPLSYYAARDGVDIDLLTRGAGFGYIGSTISSLIYASFTFIFFALEAAIMSMAIHIMVDIPLSIAYIISAIVVIPLVTHGFHRISQFQAWTQPVWIILQVLPLVYIGLHESEAFAQWLTYPGLNPADNISNGQQGFNVLLFGAAAAVIFPLIAQNGEQADFLRFLPTIDKCKKSRWWMAVVGAGPGWVIFGIIKLFIGSFLAVLAINHGFDVSVANDPAHMYSLAFSYITVNPDIALWLAGIFVIISQLKINVTNAYAGSIAWGNFFSRLTHYHPGRVVWLVFNVAIALMLMELGLYQAFEEILITYASLVVAWVGCVVADLVINKPLGLSPKHIEFRRGYLYDINPVGVISMLVASSIGIAANFGVFGELAEALAAFLSLFIPFILVPFIAWVTKGRFYLARENDPELLATNVDSQHSCRICENAFDHEDMAYCPSYDGAICSLCCALDSRCGDVCRPEAHLSAQTNAVFSKILPAYINEKLHSVSGHFVSIFIITAGIIAGLLAVVFYAQSYKQLSELNIISGTLWQVFFLFLLLTGVLIWLYVLAQKSARFALSETQLQTELLTREINAHKETAIELEQARDAANAANLAKSRYLSGVSHELRTPLNTIFGYSQLMESDKQLNEKNRKITSVIRRSSEHLSDVIEGLLEISKIEARKFDLQRDTIDMFSMIQQLDDMFRPLAESKGLEFNVHTQANFPHFFTGDEKRLRQVLLNLLSNAIKFTQQGKVELYISYRNQVARMVVKDTGIGIAEQHRNRIFEPFERVRDETTKLIQGTGLGLSISRLLVEMMGGSLELKTVQEQGSEFCLTLFLPSVSEQYTAIQRQSEIQGYVGSVQHIMVVDDEKAHRNLLNDFLQPLGFVVHQSESAEVALQVVEQVPVDLFLLDISMPGMDGWHLLTKLRERKFTVPIIMLSADPYEAALYYQKNADFQAYINKPVRLDGLLVQIQRCLSLQWRTEKQNKDKSHENSEKHDISQSNEISPGLEETLILENIETLKQIYDFAKIGYLQGVIESTEILESLLPENQFINELKLLADNCDLNTIVQKLDDLSLQKVS